MGGSELYVLAKDVLVTIVTTIDRECLFKAKVKVSQLKIKVDHQVLIIVARVRVSATVAATSTLEFGWGEAISRHYGRSRFWTLFAANMISSISQLVLVQQKHLCRDKNKS